MNIATPIDIKGIALANDILGGKLPPADYPIFTDSDWHWAAECALDCDDYSELLDMAEEQRLHDIEEEADRRHTYYAERNPNYAIDHALLTGMGGV